MLRRAGLLLGLLLLAAAPAATLEPPRNEKELKALVDEGTALYKEKRYEEALARLVPATQAAPQFGAIWVMRGNAESYSGQPEVALASFAHALALDKNDWRAQTGRGVALLTLKRFDEASAAFGRTLEIKPGDQEALRLKAASLHYAGKDAEALEAFQQVVALDPKNAGSWRLQGVSLFRLARYSEALESFDQAIRLDPTASDAWMSKGSCLVKLGRDEEALAAYDGAARRNALDPQVQYNKGVALQRLGRIDEARKALRRAVALRPDNAAAKAALEALPPGAPVPPGR